MFHQLSYSVTFPSTGRTLSADLDLDAGFWAIVGPNESGKSMILEMLRFLLFGSAALRGRAEDYKNLKASGEFTIRGERYAVSRSMRNASLKKGEEDLASGVSTVNAKIVELLGYGIGVFDMANSINQGEVERLGQLTPLERKRLIDGVLGIDALELVAKWGMEEARVKEREADAIRRTLVAPQPPTLPDNYVPTDQQDLSVLRAEAQELAEIEGWLAAPGVSKPEKPTCKVELPAENLKAFAEKRAALRTSIEGLNARISVLPVDAPVLPDNIDEQWAARDAYVAAQNWLQAHPNPEHDRQTCVDYLAQYEILDHQKRLQGQIAHIEEEIRKHESGPTHTCSSCGHEDLLGQHHLDYLRQELREAQAEMVVVAFDPTEYSRSSLEKALRDWESFDEDKYTALAAVPQAPEPPVAKHLVPVYRAQAEQVKERMQLSIELAPLVVEFEKMPDYEAMLAERRAYEAALPAYQAQLEAWQLYQGELAKRTLRKGQLAGAREKLAAAEALYAVCQAYEQAVERYDQALAIYAEKQAEADELAASAAEHRKVRDAMTTLRSLIKQHLMPSLNRVASYLLSQMTGGQRVSIVVDEDFNVVVDGQDLDTLSGSGKACANLALRIALGQVLTNRVFSVLLADEIDASMDDFRAEQTSNVLCTLENTISQVLQVSHKSIESVNQIDLGGLSDSSLLGEAA